jgi:transposase-like protein
VARRSTFCCRPSDAEAAKRFFRKALAQPHTVNPRTITVDKNAAYPKATAEMKKDGELWRRSRLRQVKCGGSGRLDRFREE